LLRFELSCDAILFGFLRSFFLSLLVFKFTSEAFFFLLLCEDSSLFFRLHTACLFLFFCDPVFLGFFLGQGLIFSSFFLCSNSISFSLFFRFDTVSFRLVLDSFLSCGFLSLSLGSGCLVSEPLVLCLLGLLCGQGSGSCRCISLRLGVSFSLSFGLALNSLGFSQGEGSCLLFFLALALSIDLLLLDPSRNDCLLSPSVEIGAIFALVVGEDIIGLLTDRGGAKDLVGCSEDALG